MSQLRLEDELREALLAPHGEYNIERLRLGKKPIHIKEAALIAEMLAPVAMRVLSRPEPWTESQRERETDGWF